MTEYNICFNYTGNKTVWNRKGIWLIHGQGGVTIQIDYGQERIWCYKNYMLTRSMCSNIYMHKKYSPAHKQQWLGVRKVAQRAHEIDWNVDAENVCQNRLPIGCLGNADCRPHVLYKLAKNRVQEKSCVRYSQIKSNSSLWKMWPTISVYPSTYRHGLPLHEWTQEPTAG